MSQDVFRRSTSLALAAGAAAITVSILFLDRPVATAMHSLHRPAWCVWLTWIADVPVPGAVLLLTIAGIAWLCGWRPGTAGRVMLAACIATLMADATKDVLKFGFGRLWPETWVQGNPSWIANHRYGFVPFHGGPGWASFPSGHTTVITAPCALAWRHSPAAFRPVWAALPALVATGLLGADFHFLGDCIAGALLGIACALFVDTSIYSARLAAGIR